MLLGRPPVETLLFSVALAVGLSPELLPAILSVNLARGAQMMAARGVLVRRLNAIENLGSMDILCTDKTGTLTEGVVRLEGAYDGVGARVGRRCCGSAPCNAALQTGLGKPARRGDPAGRGAATSPDSRKLARDSLRLRAQAPQRRRRGRRRRAADHQGRFRTRAGGLHRPARRHAARRRRARAALERASRTGAARACACWRWRRARCRAQASYGREDERELTFAASLPSSIGRKRASAKTLADSARSACRVKLITGDSEAGGAARGACRRPRRRARAHRRELDELHDEALWRAAEQTDLFVEVDPNQKERIILALKKTGHVVGFLGDGVNDAPAMHAADTSLSVGERRRRGARGRGLRAAGARPRRDPARHRGGPPHLRQHAEVRADDDQRQPRQHDQHGGGLAVPAVPAAARGPDPAQQLPLRHSGAGHRRRPRRPRAGGAAAALGHALHRPLHGRIRPAELAVRLPHLRRCCCGSSRAGAGAVPHRLVRRVAADRAGGRAGRAHAAPVLPQPARAACCCGPPSA